MAAFSETKVTEAAVHLLRLRDGKMSYLKLLKLLYLANREALHRWGVPITHDRYVSMDHGPVLSQTYNLVKDGSRVWSRHISAPQGWDIRLLEEKMEPQALSPAEEKLLDEIFAQHGNKTRWDIVDELHELPEWQDPHGSSIPISREAILTALGESPEDIQAILAELEREEQIAERIGPRAHA